VIGAGVETSTRAKYRYVEHSRSVVLVPMTDSASIAYLFDVIRMADYVLISFENVRRRLL
jgi:hypothetical protein